MRVKLHRRMAGPDPFTYSALIKACDNAGDLGKALELFAEMKAAGVTPTVITYTIVIKACSNTRDIKEAVPVFVGGHADRRHVQHPDQGVRQRRGPRQGARGPGDLGKALEVLAEMKAVVIRPNDGTFNVRIKACDNARDLGKALEVLAEMKVAGVTPTVGTFNALIKPCAGDLGKALAVLAEMKTVRVTPTAGTFDTLIKTCDNTRDL